MTIVIYFSHRGENLIDGQIQSIEVGNTEIIAKKISQKLTCPIAEIVPVISYPKKYDELLAKVEKEKQLDEKLLIEPLSVEVSDFDMIFLGYPNWLGSLPKPVASFLQKMDLRDKTIYPFCTHEGSGFGRSLKELRELAPDSRIKVGLPIRGSRARRSDKAVANWLVQFYTSTNTDQYLGGFEDGKTNSRT